MLPPRPSETHPGDDLSLDEALKQLTEQERLVCVCRRLGFTSRAIAGQYRRPVAEIDALFHAAVVTRFAM